MLKICLRPKADMGNVSMETMTKQRITLIILVIALLLLGVSGCASAPFYSAEAVRGKVVDNKTGKPLEHVIVLAQWKLVTTTRGSEAGILKIIEVETDKQGNYVIPAWGPRPRPPFRELDYRDPVIIILKEGYVAEILVNRLVSWGNRNKSSVRTSLWNGKTILLKRNGQDIERIADRLRTVHSVLPRDKSNWRKYPRTAVLLTDEHMRLYQLGLKPGRSIGILDYRKLTNSELRYLEKLTNVELPEY